MFLQWEAKADGAERSGGGCMLDLSQCQAFALAPAAAPKHILLGTFRRTTATTNAYHSIFKQYLLRKVWKGTWLVTPALRKFPA